MKAVAVVPLLIVASCASHPTDPVVGGACVEVVGARAPGGAEVTLHALDGVLLDAPCDDPTRVDAAGAYVVPGFVDSHVHLAYYPVADGLLANGVVAAVDLASPRATLGASLEPLTVVRSGPMITAPRGYPTEGWGADGYGLECAGPAECAAAVDALADEGAGIIKVPLEGAARHDDATLTAVIERAHARELLVAVHALDDAGAARAARLGADVLAHTPVERLADATVEAWRGRAVVSTLAAFGGAASTVENLRRLRAAGVTVLYGTDLGNRRHVGIDPRELALLESAGLDGAAILDAGTRAPAARWSLDRLGALEPGRDASFLLLDTDPHDDPSTLASPRAVYVRGRLQ